MSFLLMLASQQAACRWQDGGMTVVVRCADPARDAPAVADIYRPAVEHGLASFEETAPDAAAMAERIQTTLERLPWLVAELDGDVVGYAYAAPHHARPGYRWSVNVSVYVRDGATGRGIGRRLYDVLFGLLRRQGIVNVYAGITQPNPASVALHRAMGMAPVAIYERVGFKHGAWHDVAWYGLRLWEPDGPPPEPTPFGALDSGA
jgi:L-amino acid N-acyltransferase YncA